MKLDRRRSFVVTVVCISSKAGCVDVSFPTANLLADPFQRLPGAAVVVVSRARPTRVVGFLMVVDRHMTQKHKTTSLVSARRLNPDISLCHLLLREEVLRNPVSKRRRQSSCQKRQRGKTESVLVSRLVRRLVNRHRYSRLHNRTWLWNILIVP